MRYASNTEERLKPIKNTIQHNEEAPMQTAEKPLETHARGETLGSALALQVLVPYVRQSSRT